MTLSLFLISCTRDYIEPNPIPINGGFVLKLDSRAPTSSRTAEELVSDMRVMAFTKGGSAPFSHEVSVLFRSGNILRSNMRTGNWDLVLVSAQGATLASPTMGQSIAAQKMYEYTPTTDAQGYLSHQGATEIFTRRIDNLETIVADGNHTASTAISRNVAMIKVVFDKTPDIDLSGEHIVELGSVPSTISWAGGLLPSKDSPKLLSAPLKRKFTFTADASDPTMSASDTAIFIIPAHRGSDFWAADGLSINPATVDTTTQKLTVSVNLKLGGGTNFISTKEIPIVARCNGIMVAKLKINKTDVNIETSLKPWDTESINGDLMASYLNVERINAEVFGKFPTRLHFWTNQPLNSIYVTSEGVDATGGGNTPVADINTVFTELAGVGATNIACTPSPAGGCEGYIDLIAFGGDPVGVKTHKIYLKTGTIKRELNITTHGIKFVSDDAPIAVDKNGLSKDGHSLFSFTCTNPGAANFKLGLFSGTILLTQSNYNDDITNQLDFTKAAVNNIDILPRNLEIKFFAGGRWYPVKSVQQRPILAVRILTVGSNGIEYYRTKTGSVRFGTNIGGADISTSGSNQWSSGLGPLLYAQTGVGKPISDEMPLEIYYINKGAGSANYDGNAVLNALITYNIDILFCVADRTYTALHGPTEQQAKDIVEQWLEKNNFRGIIYCGDDVSVNPNWTKAVFGVNHTSVLTTGIYERIETTDPYYENDVYKSIMNGSYSNYQQYPAGTGAIMLGSNVSTTGSGATLGSVYTANPVDLRLTSQPFFAQSTYGIIDKTVSDAKGFIPLLYQSGKVAFAVHPTRRIVFQGESQFYESGAFLNGATGSLAPTINGQHPKLVMNMWEWFLNNVALGKQY